MAIYAAMIDRVDRSVGNLVAGLKERGMLDNTLIMILADNGGNAESGPRGRLEGDKPGGPQSAVFLGQSWATLNNTPFRRYKHFTHEGGISTPLIVHWPAGIPNERNGKLEHQPGHLVDVMPTAVAASGASYPSEFNGHEIQPMEGVSLLPAFAGEPLDARSQFSGSTRATARSAMANGSSCSSSKVRGSFTTSRPTAPKAATLSTRSRKSRRN